MDLDGVESTHLQFEKGLLTVEYDAADTDPQSMIAALETAGYGAERFSSVASSPLSD